MTDEAKTLVKWLRSMRSPHTGPAADLIETQAREIERLRGNCMSGKWQIFASEIEAKWGEAVKVVLNPRHFNIRAKAEDGTIWLTHEKYRQAIIPIKDVTNDVLLCLCADLSADGQTRQVERFVQFNDGFACKITVEVIKE